MSEKANTALAEAAVGASVDPEEIERFARMAGDWWNMQGKFRPLHRFNPVRLHFIVGRVCAKFGRDPNAPRPLEGLTLLDVGCGGGLLAEPLARLGARVSGIDAAKSNIEAAKLHARTSALDIDYRHLSAEELAKIGESFDVVLAMEIVEHVTNAQDFLHVCATLLKPSGCLFAATLNRSVKSYALAVVGAEYILRWLPRGTHDWRKFLTPEELSAYLYKAGLEVRALRGLSYSPLQDKWRQSEDLSVNYMVFAVKS